MSTTRGLLAAFALLALITALPSAEAGAQLDVSGSGYHEQVSFASANGTAMFTMNITNSGNEGYSAVQVSAETNDPEWPAELVNFTIQSTGNYSQGMMDLGTLDAGGSAVLAVDVSVPFGSDVGKQTDVTITVGADGDSADQQFTVTVTNWIAWSADVAVRTFNVGDSYDYTMTVENIAVNENGSEVDINDVITVQHAATGGWRVSGSDWDPGTQSMVLHGLANGTAYESTVTVTLYDDSVSAGSQEISFQSSSIDPDDPFGFPYYQSFPIKFYADVNPVYGVIVAGADSQDIDVSGGVSFAAWDVTVRNLGNSNDEFNLGWNSNLPASWSATGMNVTTGSLGWRLSGSSSFNFELNVSIPAAAGAGESGTLTLTATSVNDPSKSNSQIFTATVTQHYGLSFLVDEASKIGSPGSNATFLFTVGNPGNGIDSYAIAVDGPGLWAPTADVDSLDVTALGSGNFALTVSVPAGKKYPGTSGNINVTVTSEDGETNATETVTVSVRQIHDLAFSYALNATGVEVNSVDVSQSTTITLQVILSNNGNGYDTASLALVDAPAWATLEHTSVPVPSGGQVTISVNLAPDVTSLSGRTYTFQVQATASDGVETATSGDLSVKIAEQETEGEEPEETDTGTEEEGGIPGFGLLAALSALGLALRRRD
ncbi:MAG: hypothetical protein QGG08_01195 [Candidatus Poseidoniia archaeon]|nr:hypothetical protein [Candidatus Poseidoniia archaeon]